MFSITGGRFFLFKAPTDMRKSFDGLCGIVANQMQLNVTSGDVFVFINRSRNRMKLLRWEPGGLVLFYKRLEKGTFPLPKEGEKADLSYDELVMIIHGIRLENARKNTRFYPHKK